tara:strand:- start:923 stop:1108 length:186 start_codon:yes stop_codon:yes gene_type:complete
VPDFVDFLFLFSFSSLSLLVALCSANLRLSKSLVKLGDLGIKFDLPKVPLLLKRLFFTFDG